MSVSDAAVNELTRDDFSERVRIEIGRLSGGGERLRTLLCKIAACSLSVLKSCRKFITVASPVMYGLQ